MIRIRPLHILFYVGTIVALVACATGTEKPTGDNGEGGEGGDWGGGATSSSSSSGGTAGGGTGGGGGSVTPTTTCDINAADCTACITCSRETADGLCNVEAQNCFNDIECTDYIACFQACADGDTACLNSCDAIYPSGLDLFNVYASCVICKDCPVNCDAATACQ